MTAVVSTPAFTLILPSASAERVIGLWTTLARTSLPSFAVNEEFQTEPIWRVTLPSDPTIAFATLAEGQQAIKIEEVALTKGAATLSQFAIDLQIPGSHQIAGAEAELLASIPQPGTPSFDVLSGSDDGLFSHVSAWFRNAWEQAKSLVASMTWVETEIDGKVVARTSLGRSGDVLSAWRDDVTLIERELHDRAIRLALQSKQQLLRTLALVIRGAVLVAGALTSPISAVMAIPAIWKFLNDARANSGYE